MVETGKIIDIDPKRKRATVQFERKSACDKCRMCAFKKEDMFVRCTLGNTLDAQLGDTVKVSMGSGFVLSAALIVYGIPLLMMLIGLLITMRMSIYAQIGASVGGLVLGLVCAILIDKKIKNKKGFKPEMIEIIEGTERKDE